MGSTNAVQLRRGLVTIATLLCLGLFLSLGNWQLQRGYAKAAIEQYDGMDMGMGDKLKMVSI